MMDMPSDWKRRSRRLAALALLVTVSGAGCSDDTTPSAETESETDDEIGEETESGTEEAGTEEAGTEETGTEETGTEETGTETESDTSSDTGEDETETGPPPPCPDGAVEIAAGSFTDTGDGPNELHEITGFCMGGHEVTVEAYETCVAEGGCEAIPEGAHFGDDSGFNTGAPDRADHPINGTTWLEATAYCDWAGGYLPSEWEWEWVARGRDEGRTFPWGGTDPDCSLAVMDEGQGLGCGENSTAPAGSRSPQGDSVDGVADMAGNVWEWVDSWHDGDQNERVLRGGSWGTSNVQALATGLRNQGDPTIRDRGIGFRCAFELI